MIDPALRNLPTLQTLAPKHHAGALWLFGSATTSERNAESSDVDVLVDLGAYEDTVGMRYLSLKIDLERLFDRSVDLVTTRQVRSEWFADEIERSKVLMYETTNLTVVA